jgi:hypothetical protein
LPPRGLSKLAAEAESYTPAAADSLERITTHCSAGLQKLKDAVNKLGSLQETYEKTFVHAFCLPFDGKLLDIGLKKAGSRYAQCLMAATMQEVRRLALLQQQQPAAAAAAAGGAKVQRFRVQASCQEKQAKLLDEAVMFVNEVHCMAFGLTGHATADFVLLRSMRQQVKDGSVVAAAADGSCS